MHSVPWLPGDDLYSIFPIGLNNDDELLSPMSELYGWDPSLDSLTRSNLGIPDAT